MASILDLINKAKRIEGNYSFIDTIIDGAFNFHSAPLKVSTWFVSQLIFNALLNNSISSNLATQSTSQLPNVITNTTPSKVVYSHLVKNATQQGKEYLQELKKTPPIPVNSTWIKEIWWVPNPTNHMIGSIGVSFDSQATYNKPPVLTPPWFNKELFFEFKKANSKGRFYLDQIAIKQIGMFLTLSAVASQHLAQQFYSQAKYYAEIKGLNDVKARQKIIDHSNYMENNLFPATKEIYERLEPNVAGQINNISNQNLVKHSQLNSKELADLKAIRNHVNARARAIAKLQTLFKLVARGIRNPEELAKNTAKTKLRNTVPNARVVNNVIDIFKRKGANLKQMGKNRLKVKSQKKLNSWLTRQHKKQVQDKLDSYTYQIHVARLENKGNSKVHSLIMEKEKYYRQNILLLETKTKKPYNRRKRRSRRR